MKIDKIKLKTNLEKHLGRPAKESELGNAEKDVNLLVEIVLDKLDDLEKRIELLEKK